MLSSILNTPPGCISVTSALLRYQPGASLTLRRLRSFVMAR